jgi:serine/threonine-protein kinase
MYQWAREYNPSNFELAGYLASAHYWVPGDSARAAALYREAVDLGETWRATRGSNAHVLSILGTLYVMTSHPDSATALTERAVAAAPNDPDVQYRAGLVYEGLGQREKALRYLASAFDLGQSVRQIQNEPFLAELREDKRYEVIAQGFGDRGNYCDE